MLSGATTAPTRQTASQIKSFSRFSSESSSTRLPFRTPCFESVAAMSVTACSSAPNVIEARMIEVDDRKLVRIAAPVPRQQIGDRSVWDFRPMLAEHMRHG